MTHVLILGASGMLGRKLCREVQSALHASTLTLADVMAPDIPGGVPADTRARAVDITDGAALDELIAEKPNIIFHLAAIVSGEAEADFEKGYRINLDGTRNLFEAIRQTGASTDYCPRVVFSSSLAVFGGPYPEQVPDSFLAAPQNSYGAQKAMSELLLADYSRRRIFDGVGLRLPTICVRPGAPNKAASGFFSNIIREPLQGKPALLPVPDTLRAWLASPRAAVKNLLLAAELDTSQLGARRTFNLPGLSVTVAEQIEALRDVAGAAAVGLIERQHDPSVEDIVSAWPARFDAALATALGFQADASFASIISNFLEDDME